jgi:hypothetical protein
MQQSKVALLIREETIKLSFACNYTYTRRTIIPPVQNVE